MIRAGMLPIARGLRIVKFQADGKNGYERRRLDVQQIAILCVGLWEHEGWNFPDLAKGSAYSQFRLVMTMSRE